VIASDINRGLFIFDVSEALTRNIPPATYLKVRGVDVSGNLASLLADDDNRLTLRPGAVLSSLQAPIEVEVTMKADSTTPNKLDVHTVSRGSAATLQERIHLFNYQTSQFEQVGTRMLTAADVQQ